MPRYILNHALVKDHELDLNHSANTSIANSKNRSEREEYGMSDGDVDISSSPERGDVSDCIDAQEHDMELCEQYAQLRQHNSTV